MEYVVIEDLLARCIMDTNEDKRRGKQDVGTNIVLAHDQGKAGPNLRPRCLNGHAHAPGRNPLTVPLRGHGSLSDTPPLLRKGVTPRATRELSSASGSCSWNWERIRIGRGYRRRPGASREPLDSRPQAIA